MSKKPATDTFQSKISRYDRFAQMSHQELVIEQKKKEILAKLEAKRKGTKENEIKKSSPSTKASSPPKDTKTGALNAFSNDGSFLDTFKQLKEKRFESKLKSFRHREHYDKSSGDGLKSNRWSQQRRRTPSPKDRPKSRMSRFDKTSPFEQKITINTSFSTTIPQPTFPDQTPQPQQISINPQNVTGQPLLKNIVTEQPSITVQEVLQSSASVIAAPPLLLNVPPPQIIQNQLATPVVLSQPSQNVLTTVSLANVIPTQQASNVLPPQEANILAASQQGSILAPAQATNIALPQSVVLTTVSLPTTTIIASQAAPVSVPDTATCIQTMELAAIPPPNPIQIQNIPQPEPLNTLNIPPPAPIQVQNIPTPTTIQLNEIPNPKPLDLLAIPTPNDENISDPNFIKNIPPPNKAVPPPTLPENSIQNSLACLPMQNILTPQSIGPATLQQTMSMQSLASAQNVMLHSLNQSQVTQLPQQQNQLAQTIQNITAGIPPPSIQAANVFTSVASISVSMPMGIVDTAPATVTNAIPSLMAQPVLPPPGMGLNPPQINVNCPPPLISVGNPVIHSASATFTSELAPMNSQMPPMNIPPPPPPSLPSAIGTNHGMMHQQQQNILTIQEPLRDLNAGTPDYEAMVSLGRMVAQCGPGIEDIVRQRKPQDPSLWFLFYKESAAYRQYRHLVEQFTAEMASLGDNKNISSSDKYEPEIATEDDLGVKYGDRRDSVEKRDDSLQGGNKRKRRSRWGDKDLSIPPPTVLQTPQVPPLPPVVPLVPVIPLVPPPQQQQQQSGGSVMLSKVTRTDPGLIQYAINSYGSANLSEEDWKKAEDNYKINLLYQDMIRKKQEVEKLQKIGKNKYEYDSDEETDGGTWEHRLRDKEMMATQLWAQELTRQAEGKHHIGDFLPPEELKKFMEKSTAVKEGRQPSFSDYKEYKIKEDNIGFKMLQKLGWTEGEGLGQNGGGIVEPVNKALVREANQGLGAGESNENEDEYESYRKRMMLAYRFRPNPLNNPRRPYY